ncbi:hypothetical protein AGMMS4957_17190 [Bacteroidia bacterium]|nr:hypothetical protein AGMMS4957_17190 [Bacteroidia bacterium]
MNAEDKKYYKERALHYKNEAKLRKCCAAVHVESYDDKIFWSKVFEHYLPQYSFHYITYSRTPKGETAVGCTACLKYHEGGCLSKDFFICIDSDYRYLLREKDIDIEHFVFQTYTYSIENHYCFSLNIDDIFRHYGYNNFNVYSFLKAYSKTLYDLFICHLISKSKDDRHFTLKDFQSFLVLDTDNLDGKQIISNLKHAISEPLVDKNSKYTKSEIRQMRRKCGKLGLTSNTAYRYLRGHNINDDVIGVLLKQLEAIVGQEGISIGNNIYFDKYVEINRIKFDIKQYEQL